MSTGYAGIDASIWTAEEDGGSFPGLALVTPTDVVAGNVRYPVHRVGGSGELAKLPAAVQGPLTALEVQVSAAARTDDDLLVVDGPLRNRRQLPRTLGYIKTQHSQYLDARLTAVVTGLPPGHRSPVFRLGTPGAAGRGICGCR